MPIAAEKIPHPKGEKMPRVHLFTFLYAYVSVKACALGFIPLKRVKGWNLNHNLYRFVLIAIAHFQQIHARHWLLHGDNVAAFPHNA